MGIERGHKGNLLECKHTCKLVLGIKIVRVLSMWKGHHGAQIYVYINTERDSSAEYYYYGFFSIKLKRKKKVWYKESWKKIIMFYEIKI